MKVTNYQEATIDPFGKGLGNLPSASVPLGDAGRLEWNLLAEDVSLPAAAVSLAQGVGRLIRTTTDRGVVAVLDPRLMLPSEDPLGKRYAAQVRAALPPFPVTRDWERVEAFLQSL